MGFIFNKMSLKCDRVESICNQTHKMCVSQLLSFVTPPTLSKYTIASFNIALAELHMPKEANLQWKHWS